MNQASRFRSFACVLLALALSGCVAAVDEDVTDSSSDALSGAVADCESAPLTSEARNELAPAVLDSELAIDSELSIDATQAGSSSSTCRRVCACCSRNGNRFCCSHCRLCSGPIGVTDVLAR